MFLAGILFDRHEHCHRPEEYIYLVKVYITDDELRDLPLSGIRYEFCQ
jgi:hypothetical protein